MKRVVIGTLGRGRCKSAGSITKLGALPIQGGTWREDRSGRALDPRSGRCVRRDPDGGLDRCVMSAWSKRSSSLNGAEMRTLIWSTRTETSEIDDLSSSWSLPSRGPAARGRSWSPRAVEQLVYRREPRARPRKRSAECQRRQLSQIVTQHPLRRRLRSAARYFVTSEAH